MKASAFFIRIAICWGLALIPFPEQESQILETRLQWTGWSAQAYPTLRTLPYVATGALSFGLVISTSLAILSSTILLSAIAVPASGILILVLLYQAVLVVFHFHIPMINGVVALLSTYLVFTGYLQAVQENRQWRSLKEAQYLHELDEMKSNFLSLVSHDLKTPIAKIQAVVDRMRRETAPPEEQRKELLDSIETSNQELKHYITSILNLSRIESQKVILNKKSNDINGTIRETIRRLRPLANQGQVQVDEDLEPLFSIEYDEGLVKQVLGNLIDNAIKYSPAGAKVIVRSREEEGFVQVDIQDFGPGIPREQIPHMFTKFYRFKRPLNEKVKGTGLGLYLSKYFIELHGGTIRLRSVENTGTTFTFTLPLHGIT